MQHRKLKQFIFAISSVVVFGAAQADVHFCYDQPECGPANWGDLAPEFHLCKDGLKQSPINLYHAKETNIPALQVDYQSTPLTIINNGHTAQVNYASGSVLTVGTKKYRLLQFHFHTPSEHLKDGRTYPLEAHMVHVDDYGNLAVLSLFLKEGDATNAFLKPIFDNLPTTPGSKTIEGVNVNVGNLLPSGREYFTYTGSLTTPPCSEGVTWMVLEDSVIVSKAQIAQFRAIFEGNARPEQPLNGRTIRALDN